MKRTVILFIFLLPFIASTSLGEQVFRFYDLEGIEVTHTEFGRRPSKGTGFLTLHTRISESVAIHIEQEEGEEIHYIVHGGGRHRVFSVSGESSVTFIETYGGNNFLWTICFEEKNDDGSFLLIMVSNQTDGLIGIRSKIFRGKAELSE